MKILHGVVGGGLLNLLENVRLLCAQSGDNCCINPIDKPWQYALGFMTQ